MAQPKTSRGLQEGIITFKEMKSMTRTTTLRHRAHEFTHTHKFPILRPSTTRRSPLTLCQHSFSMEIPMAAFPPWFHSTTRWVLFRGAKVFHFTKHTRNDTWLSLLALPSAIAIFSLFAFCLGTALNLTHEQLATAKGVLHPGIQFRPSSPIIHRRRYLSGVGRVPE